MVSSYIDRHTSTAVRVGYTGTRKYNNRIGTRNVKLYLRDGDAGQSVATIGKK